MANEFITRNGIISLGSIQVTGSITATGGVIVSGSIASASYAQSSSYALSSSFSVSGSRAVTSSFSISGSNAVTSSYSISGSYAVSSSFAATASAVNQLNQPVVVTGSLAVSGSAGTTLFNVAADTLVFSGSAQITGSFGMTGSVSSIGGFTGSLLGTASNATLFNTRDSSTFANTGSNTFTGNQYISSTSNPLTFTTTASLYTDGGLRVSKDSFISGTAYFNNVVVYGTSSIQYITSSQINVGANIINLNTQLPAQRFGGMAVADSGSNAGVTGSLLWDSVNNGWIYSRESGSSYRGGALISGPRTQVQGSEQTTIANYIMKGQGGDHITGSQIYDDGTTVQIPGNLQVTGSLVGSSTVTATNGLLIGDGGATATTNYLPKFTGTSTIGNSIVQDNGSRILINTGTTNQNTTINAIKIAMSRTSDGAEVVYFSKNTDLGSDGTANIHGYDGIQFRTQGAESVKATLTASGNLGLGTTSPSYPLTISATTANTAFYNTFSNSANRNWALAFGVGSLGDFNIMVSNAQSGDPISAGTSKFNIQSNGNVGIGTTNPGQNLTVYGTGTLATTFQQWITVNGTQRLMLGANTTAAEVQSAGSIPLYINYGGNRTVINGSGVDNVLIGTTTDNGQKVQVNGNMLINNTIYSSTGAGGINIDGSANFTALVNNAYVQFPSMSGLIIVNNTGTGAVQVFICGGGNVTSLGYTTNVTGTMTYDSSVSGYRFTNNTGSTWTYSFMVIKTRGTA